MRVPASTYRLQLNAEFPFARVRELIDYFRDLGVGDLYFSPIFEARAGSPHGYDVTNPGRVNPEIGQRDELAALSGLLHEAGIGILIDIVPNHMAASEENPWWRDILIHGPASLAAHFFDVDWEAGSRVVLPVLGRPLEEAFTAGELDVVFHGGAFAIAHFARAFPLDPATYGPLLSQVEGVEARILADVERIGPRRAATAEAKEARRRAALALEQQFGSWAADESNATALAERLDRLSIEELRDLLAAQAYSLEYWRTGTRRINYRRFFDIADLAAVRVEDPDVFATTHSLILQLLRAGHADGVRIDHVDGLRDPALYLAHLRPALGDAYVVVEKILAPKEDLPENWPVEGTTGYDFTGLLAGLYCDPVGLARMTESYAQRTGSADFPDVVYETKKLVIHALFAAELAALTEVLLAAAAAANVIVDRAAAAECISEITAALHVYRTYVSDDVGSYDRCVIKHAVNAARHRAPHIPDALYGVVRSLLLNEDLPSVPDAVRAHFVADWQQFTGPVMAKGSEDTALYTYNAMLALSEVGAHPAGGIASADEFHAFMTRRAQRWPYTMNASSTHDTKRSEDVRARLQVLSEMPDAWEAALARWSAIAERYRASLDGMACPDANEEILIFQTLLGVWPLSAHEEAALPGRIGRFLTKALREAKLHSSWTEPNESYEGAVISFAQALLGDAEFLEDFRKLQADVAWFGALNSLSQLVVKLGAPGLPDIYQGNESWTFRLVDPDNRRRVDFQKLAGQLAALPAEPNRGEATELLKEWHDGRIKLHTTRAGLQLRRTHARLFTNGAYIPVAVRGRYPEHVIAFARRSGTDWALVVAGRYYSKLGPRPVGHAWSDTALVLPADAPRAWRNVLTNEVTNGSSLEAVFATLPFALLLAQASE